MGYTIDSKKKMLDFMAIRDDVSVTAVTQIFSIITKIAMPVIVDTDNATSINFLKIGIVAPEYINGDGVITEVYLELENTDTGAVIYDGEMNFNILAATAPGEETYGDYWISMVDLISDVTPNIGNFRVRIKFIDNNGVESDFSLWKSFNVSDVQ
jgi:hypothetical protein